MGGPLSYPPRSSFLFLSWPQALGPFLFLWQVAWETRGFVTVLLLASLSGVFLLEALGLLFKL